MWTIVRSLLIIIALVVLYFVLPAGGKIGVAGWGLTFGIGLLMLSAVFVIVANRMLKRGVAAKAMGMLSVLTVGVLFFARADYLLALQPGQFAELHTKIDALYFAVSTLATVGFGDIHATGQAARAAVTVQMVFNLVFIGIGISLVSGLLKHRVRSRSSGASQHPAEGSSFPS
jgi:voltage-gated potassium channel